MPSGRFRAGLVGTGSAERAIDVRSSAVSESDNDDRPTIDDVDPGALAVNSVDDDVRVSADPGENEIVDSGGERLRVDESEGDRVRPAGRSAASDGEAEGDEA
jgi:hypothetical protein